MYKSGLSKQQSISENAFCEEHSNIKENFGKVFVKHISHKNIGVTNATKVKIEGSKNIMVAIAHFPFIQPCLMWK